MRRKFVSIILSLFMLSSVGSLAACDFFGDSKNAQKQAYVSLDINPAVELIVDRENKVVSVRGENEDGQVLLYDETGIKGESIDEAIQKITDIAVKCGYLDQNNKVVDALVTSENEKFAKDVLSKVNTSVATTAANLGINVTMSGEGAYSLLRKMEEVKKQFPNNTAIQNMSVQKFKLALSVSEADGISIDAAVALDDAELIKTLTDANAKVEEYATDAYLKAKTKATAVFEQVTELACYSEYTKYYLENLLEHPLTAHYGGIYQAYASGAKAFDVIFDVALLATEVQTQPLDQAQIETVANILGMQSVDQLKNFDGEITVESIEAYADKTFKNTPASEILEQTKKDLSAALSQTETTIKEKVNQLAEEYKPQIESAITSTRQLITTVENTTSLLPAEIKAVIKTCSDDVKAILTEIKDVMKGEKIELDDLMEKAKKLDVKAKEYLEKIEADLSEEELKELNERIESVIEKMSVHKQAFEKAIDDAAKEARDHLSKIKEERKNAKK
jgi:uncharacterized protein YunC (DUF1805 family)